MDTKLFCPGLLQLQPVTNVKTLLIVPIQSKAGKALAIRGFKTEVEKALPSLYGKKWVKFFSGITEQCTLFDQYRELLMWYLYLLEVRQNFCLHNYRHTIPFINTKFILYKKKSSKDIFKQNNKHTHLFQINMKTKNHVAQQNINISLR